MPPQTGTKAAVTFWSCSQPKPLPSYVVVTQQTILPLRELLDNMNAQFFYLQFKFTPKIGHTFADEREVVVEVPKRLVQRKLESINESLKEVIALGLAKSAALGTFPTEAERVVDLYEEDPPIWYPDRPPVMTA